MIMSKVPCWILLLAMLCALSAAMASDNGHIDIKENFLDEYQNEEPKKESTITKCYDDETKLSYKLDSVWYPQGKCQKRICTRQKDTKTPIIKTIKCEPCNDCKFPQVCQPFKPEKNYPKCCEQCLTKTVILKKPQETKKYQNV